MRFTDQVVFITGGARGQGRSHAVEFAREGADIALLDVCGELDTAYPASTPDDLEETRAAVESAGRRCVAIRADVRDPEQMSAAAETIQAALGRIDVLVANAGILNNALIQDLDHERFQNMIDTNLGGVFNSIKAVLPTMLEQGSGRIIAISSIAGRRAYGRGAHYAASKWAIIGLIKEVALDLARTGITANAVCPGTVNTVMAVNDELIRAFRPDLDQPTLEDFKVEMAKLHPQGISWIEPLDVTRTVMHLASEAGRHVTGDVLTVSGGMMAQNSS